MKIKFIGYTWSICNNNKQERSQLPTGPSVYIILIKSPLFEKPKMVYIGRSTKLKNRMMEHEVLIFLRRYSSDFDILIYHRNFIDNRIELQLIEKYYHRLPFNQNKKEKPKYTIEQLFTDLKCTLNHYAFKRYTVK